MAAVTHLTIVTPTAKKFEGDAELVIAPGAAGDLGALAAHAPLLTTLRVGVVKANVVGGGAEAQTGDAAPGRVEFAVPGGFMEVLPDRVIVLTDAAISQKRGVDDGEERHAVAWAQARLEVTHRPI